MYYAIGDIHGEFSLLVDLYGKILYDIESVGDIKNTIVFLGDYMDRGTGSLKVMKFLRELEDTPRIKHVFIQGNHESMFLDAIEYPYSKSEVSFWIRHGGAAVLEEANMDWDYFREIYPHQTIVRWLKSKTRFYHESDCYVFVHGGLDVRRDVSSQTSDVLMWARRMDRGYYSGYRKMVIHGHTADKEPFIDDNRICIDTSRHPTKKILTAAVLKNENDGSVRFLNTERPL